jgi:hypothetical protein
VNKGGDEITVEFGTLWIGVSIIVTGGMMYATLMKLVEAINKQK